MQVIVLREPRTGEPDELVEDRVTAHITEVKVGALFFRKKEPRLCVRVTPYRTHTGELPPSRYDLRHVALIEANEREKVELQYHRFDLQPYRRGMFDSAKAEWRAGRADRERRKKESESDSGGYDPYMDV